MTIDWMARVASLLNVQAEDLAGLPLSTASAMCMVGGTYFLQPLGDTLALVMGIELSPLVTVGQFVLICIITPLYAAVVRRLPTPLVLPFIFRTSSVILVLFALAFHYLPDSKMVSICCSVYLGTISLFNTTTFFGRLASLHSKAKAKRVYGIIAAGGQCGQLLVSFSAMFFFRALGNLVVLCSVALYECTVQLMACRSKVNRLESTTVATELPCAGTSTTQQNVDFESCAGASPGTAAQVAERGCFHDFLQSSFGGFYLLASTPFLRAISMHTLLTNVILTGVWFERAAEVSATFSSDDARYRFFSTLNAIVGSLTLIIQVLCFSRFLRIFSFRTLLVEPLGIITGLCVALVHPGILSIALLDGLRKVIHYSLVKPTKEGLYAALSKDTVFVAKPLLDTLIYRMGSLIGAGLFTASLNFELTSTARKVTLLMITAVWAGNAWWLGILAERQQREQEIRSIQAL